jgi:hypothetical protein
MIGIKMKSLNESVLELVCLNEGQVQVACFYCMGVRCTSVTRVNYSVYIKTLSSPIYWGGICFTGKISCLATLVLLPSFPPFTFFFQIMIPFTTTEFCELFLYAKLSCCADWAVFTMTRIDILKILFIFSRTLCSRCEKRHY